MHFSTSALRSRLAGVNLVQRHPQRAHDAMSSVRAASGSPQLPQRRIAGRSRLPRVRALKPREIHPTSRSGRKIRVVSSSASRTAPAAATLRIEVPGGLFSRKPSGVCSSTNRKRPSFSMTAATVTLGFIVAPWANRKVSYPFPVRRTEVGSVCVSCTISRPARLSPARPTLPSPPVQ